MDDTKSEINGRIEQIRSRLFDGNNKAFSQKVGEIEQTISQICLGKRNAGIEIIKKIIINIPELNANWLIAGRGEMLLQPQYKAPAVEQKDMVSLEKYCDMVRENERLRLEIEALKEAASRYATREGAFSATGSLVEV